MAGGGPIRISSADASYLAPVMDIMRAAFEPVYGEAWTTSQAAAILSSPFAWMLIADLDGRPAGFTLSRAVAGEAELLLIAVHPDARGKGVGGKLLEAVMTSARERGAEKLFLEVRACNPASALYVRHGFAKVGERLNYYRGVNGQVYDAHSYSLML